MMERKQWRVRILAVLMAVAVMAGLFAPSVVYAEDPPTATGDPVEAVSVKINWSDIAENDHATDGIKLSLKANGAVQASNTVTAVDNWVCTWTKPTSAYTVELDESSIPANYTAASSNTGDNWTFTLTKMRDYYESHPKHTVECKTQAGGYACGRGATILVQITPYKANDDPLSDLPDTQYTVSLDGSEVIRNTVDYKTGGVASVRLYGVLPGSHTLTVTGADTGKYKLVSKSPWSFSPSFGNWPDDPNNPGKPLSGSSISNSGGFYLVNTYNWDGRELEVWAYPHYEEQTSNVAVSVDIQGYTAEEKDAMSFSLALCDANGTAVAGQAQKTADKSNGWSVSWTELPYGSYTVRRMDTRELVTPENGSAVFVEEKPSDNITIQATVSWKGFTDKEIPNSVKLELVDADGKVQDTASVGRLNNWIQTWVVERGEYTVREKEVPEGAVAEYDSDVLASRNRVEWSVVNTKADSKTVYLTWDGFGTSTPVSAVQISIRDSSGSVVRTATLTDSTGWSASWNDLDPDEYYTCEETTTGAWTATITKSTTGWHIINAATMSVTANLTWSGYSNSDYPVDTVYVQLYDSSGNSVGSAASLTSMRGWRYTWSDLPVDDYTVVETTTGNWKVDYKITGGASGTGTSKNMTVAITNTKTNTSSVTVKVVWSGYGTDDEPVDYVRMVLVDEDGDQYGGAVQVRDSASWTYTWKDLPVGDYTVEQTTTGDWKTEYKQSGTTWTVTNTKTNTLSVTAKVTWSGYSADADYPSSVVLKLTQTNAAAGSAAAQGLLGTATKANNWTYTWTDLQDGGVYDLEEITTGDWNPEYTRVGTTGKTESWTVKNVKSSDVPSAGPSQTGALAVALVWEGYSSSDTLPESVTVQALDETGAVGGSTSLNAANSWRSTITGLDASKTYSVREITTGDWTASITASGNNGWLIRNVKNGSSAGGGTAIGPTGGGTSAAGETGGSTGGTSAAGETGGSTGTGGTSYSNPPKTSDTTLIWLGVSCIAAAAVVLLIQKRRELLNL